jgi:RHS repeat-associated protein
LTETLTGGDVITYGYDNAGQLTSEARTGTTAYSISYTYDNAGNRATKVQGGTTDTYTYDNAEKLTSTSSKTYGYDNAGNMTSVTSGGVTTSLTWDAEERLKTVSVGGTTTQTNTYNGLDQRVKKVEGANTFTFTLQDDAIDSDVLSDGAASYMQGAGGLIGDTRGGTSKYYHADALGTTRAITNSSQTKTDSLDTDAFGMSVAVTGSTPTPFGFAGQHGYQNDSVTGLMRLGHRYYDASVGRFLSRDPIQDGYNWYAYVGNDPVNGVDPEGLAIGIDDAIVIYWIVGGIIVVGSIVIKFIHDHWDDLPTIQWPSIQWPSQASGDLSPEEYDKHKRAQQEAEARIRELEERLRNARKHKDRKDSQNDLDKERKRWDGHDKEIKQKWPNGRH